MCMFIQVFVEKLIVLSFCTPLFYILMNNSSVKLFLSKNFNRKSYINIKMMFLNIGNEGDEGDADYDCDADYEGDPVTRKFPDEECERDVVGNTLTVQSIILQRYPELLKPPDTAESLYSDRNSSYDNVERRMERNQTPDSRIDRTYDPSEWKTMLDTDESDVERIKRNTSFKERLDPLLCKFVRVVGSHCSIIDITHLRLSAGLVNAQRSIRSSTKIKI